MSRLSSVGRLFVVGSHTRPEFESISIWESFEVSDFSSYYTSPDIIDTGNGFEQFGNIFEPELFVCLNNLSFESSSLSFEQSDVIDEISEASSLNILEQLVMSEEPSLSGNRSYCFRASDISSQEYGPQISLGVSDAVGELSPVSCELSKLHSLFVSDPSERTFVSSESFSDIESIVSVVFSSLSSEICKFGSVSDIDFIDGVSEFVDEPFDEADSFDSEMSRLWLFVEPFSDFVYTFRIEGSDANFIASVIDRCERNGHFVQVNTDEGFEIDFVSCCHNRVLSLKGVLN